MDCVFSAGLSKAKQQMNIFNERFGKKRGKKAALNKPKCGTKTPNIPYL